MVYLFNVLIVFGSIVGMEFVAWGLHKFILHGFLWGIHEDHHKPRKGKFEKNDLVAFFFAIPSWLCMMFGIMNGNDFKLYIGIGIAIYGLFYILFHDGLIHRRIRVFQNPHSVYLLGCKLGHLAHHKNDLNENYDKNKDVVYGMLWVPSSYFNQAREQLNRGKRFRK